MNISFERGRDPKKSMEIGMDSLTIIGLSILKGIDFSEFGESWNWKKIRRNARIHRKLNKLRKTGGSEGIAVTFNSESGKKYGSYCEQTSELGGKILEFQGVYYEIPKK